MSAEVPSVRRDKAGGLQENNLAQVLTQTEFLSSNLQRYSARLRNGLRELLQKALKPSSSSAAASVDVDALLASLKHCTIDWCEIFQQHDKQQRLTLSAAAKDTSRTNESKAATATSVGTTKSGKRSMLQILLGHLNDPNVWPVPCLLPVLTILVEALTEHASTLQDRRRSSAQQLVRRFVLRALKRVPAWRNAFTLGFVLPPINNTTTSSSSSSKSILTQIQLRLSLLKEWMSEFPTWSRDCFIPNLANLLHVLDQLDAQEASKPKPPPTNTTNIGNRRHKSVLESGQTIDLLHGDLIECDLPAATVASMAVAKRSQQQRWNNAALATPSAKKVLQSTTPTARSSDHYCCKHDWVTRQRLRTKCILRILPPHCGGDEATTHHALHYFQRPSTTMAVLHQLLNQLAVYQSNVNSLCWSVVLFVEQQPNRGLVALPDLVRLLWKRRYQHPIYVSLYFECLGELSLFDDPQHLWDALQLFVDFVDLATVEADDDGDIDNGDGNEEDVVHRESVLKVVDPVLLETCYRQGFAWLLTRRGAMLRQQQEFAVLATKLSVLFSDSCDWIGRETAEPHRVLMALQSTGILGVASLLSCSNGVEEQQNTVVPKFQRLRPGSRSCSLDFRQSSLFSMISPDNGVPECLKKSTPNRGGVCINADVLSHVFSFLGFRRVVRLRQVSSEWRTVADSNSLWMLLYKQRFHLLPQDEAANNPNRHWKNLFSDQVIAEREALASSCRTTGRRFFCQFVGCHEYFNTEVKRRKHHEQHIKQKKRALNTKKQKARSKTSCSEQPKKKQRRKMANTQLPLSQQIPTETSERPKRKRHRGAVKDQTTYNADDE